MREAKYFKMFFIWISTLEVKSSLPEQENIVTDKTIRKGISWN
jgi:hypothetical protein